MADEPLLIVTLDELSSMEDLVPDNGDPYLLISVEELAATLEWTLDDDEMRLAQGALEDLSEDARFYGDGSWTYDTAPRQVKSLVRRAVARHLRNPDGYTVSRAGDETVGWTDKGDSNGVLTFSDREIKMLRQMAGRRGVLSVDTYAYRSSMEPDPAPLGLVPTAGGGDPFPYFNDASPW